MNFNKQFADMLPTDFVNEIIVNGLRAKSVIVGSNFRFGKDASGSVDILSELLSKKNIKFSALEPIRLRNTICSSSVIREFVKKGEMAKAREFLGRMFFFSDVQIKNLHIDDENKTLIFDLTSADQIMPAFGFYFTFIKFKNEGRLIPSITIVKKSLNSNYLSDVRTCVFGRCNDVIKGRVSLFFFNKIKDNFDLKLVSCYFEKNKKKCSFIEKLFLCDNFV